MVARAKYNYVGTDAFQFYATGVTGDSNVATVTVALTNTAPVAYDASTSTVHGRAVSGSLNATDDDGDALTYQVAVPGAHGTVSLDGSSYTYTPADRTFVGTDTFQFSANDGAADSNPATVTVVSTNGTPVAYDASATVVHGQTVTGNLPASDDDGDVLTCRLAIGASGGSVTVNGDGSYSYTANANFTGTDSFQFLANDGAAASEPATVAIDVTNQVPVADSGSNSVVHGRTVADNLSSSDGDGDSRSYRLATAPSGGTATVNGDGSYSYTANANFAGADSFQFVATDGFVDSDPATVTIDVTNQAPTADSGSNSVLHGHTVTGSLTSSDGDGDASTYRLASDPSDGSVTVNGDGTYTYTANTNYAGTDSFQFVANDGIVNSDPATVTISVTNQLPLPNDANNSVVHGQTVSGQLSAVDPDNDPLTYRLASSPNGGTVTANSDGTYSYTANADYTGTDAFQFVANDGLGDSNSGTVTIYVTNQMPSAESSWNSVLHGQSVSGTLSGSDPEGDPLTYSLSYGASSGSVTMNGDGSYTYTPNSSFTGTDSFQYVVNDGFVNSYPATVMITVTNQTPTATGGSTSVLHGQTVTGTLSATDGDGDTLTYSLASGPNGGSLTMSGDGSYSYTANVNFTGTDYIQFYANDGVSSSNLATVSINVTDQSPLVSNQNYQVVHDQTLTISDPARGLLAASSDPDGDNLTVISSTQPAYGSVSTNSDGTFTYTPAAGFGGWDSFSYTVGDGATSTTGTVSISVDMVTVVNPDYLSNTEGDTFSWTVPASDALYRTLNYSAAGLPNGLSIDPLTGVISGTIALGAAGDGPYQTTISATDGLDSDSQTFIWYVNSPVSLTNPGDQTNYESDSVTLQLTASSSHGGTLSYAAVGLPDGLTVDPTTGYITGTIASGDAAIGYYQTTVSATDGTYSDSQSFTWNINNPVTVTNPGEQNNLEGDAVSLQIVASDASGGTLHYSATALPGGLSIDPDTGSITGTLTAGDAAIGTYQITVAASNGVSSDSQSFYWNISAAPAAPIAADEAYDLAENGELTPSADRNLLTYAYTESDNPLTVQLVAGPTHTANFTLNADGEFDYLAAANYFGSDSFSFLVSAGTKTSAVHTVSLTISSTPVGTDDTYGLPLNDLDNVTPLTVSAARGVLANDLSPTSGSTLNAVLVSGPSSGTIELRADGSFTYIPDLYNPAETTTVTFQYQPVVNGTTNIGNSTKVTLIPVGAVPAFHVNDVRFTNARPILEDGTTTPFNTGWESLHPNLDNPLALVAGQEVRVKATFTMDGTNSNSPPPVDLPPTMQVVGTTESQWPNTVTYDPLFPISFEGTATRVTDGGGTSYVLANAAFKAPLLPTVASGLKIYWHLLFPNGHGLEASTVNAAARVSENDIYVLRKTPPANIPLYHTLVDLSTRGAAAATDQSDLSVAKAIAKQFESLSIVRSDHQDIVGPSPVLSYWKNWTNCSVPANQTIKNLLATGDGSCIAWAKFGAAALLLHGVNIGANPCVDLTAKALGTNLSLVVGKWDIAKPLRVCSISPRQPVLAYDL